MIPADEVLEALDLSRAEPGTGFLEALFSRFNAKVPFENASKILRDAEIAAPEDKPRRPEVFWADHLEQGAGGTCFARVAAFQWLIESLGFRSRRLLGRVQREGDHAALLVETATEPIVADVGFPLPALFPARAGSVETPLGELEIAETDEGIRIALRGGVPEGPRALDLFTAAVPPQRFDELWRETYRPGSRFLLEVNLRRDLGNRVLSFAAGEIRVDDLHTRLRLTPAGSVDAALSELFGMAPELLSRAFARTGHRAAAAAEPILTAYLETHVSAGQAYAVLASPAGYRGLVEGIGEVVGETDAPGGFRIALAAPGTSAASIVDEVTLDPGELRVSVRRTSGKSVHLSSYRSGARDGRTYLLREAVVPGSGPELLRNDSLRGRLAGSLAVDLLAWARKL